MADEDKKEDQTNTDTSDEQKKADEAKASAEKEAKEKEDADKAVKEKADAEKDKAKDVEYTDFTFRKGVEVDEGMKTEFKAVAKELNLSQEQAQKMVDLQSKFADDHSKVTAAQFEKDKETWKADAIKALGSDSKEQLALGAKAMDKFGSPELKTLLSDSGLANRIEIIQLMSNIGKAVSEDKLVDGKNSKKELSPAEIMYPTKK